MALSAAIVDGVDDAPRQPPLIGIGLSPANLARLERRLPVVVRGDVIGVGFDVMVFAGEDERAMLDLLGDPRP